jgi:ribonuclease BN (tRNA processing enzyme)
VGLGEVDAVVLSHSHPDHWSDLELFFVACRYVVRRSDIPVYAPSGIADLMRIGVTSEPTFRWREITEADRVGIGPMELSFSQTDHPVETLAVRVDAGGRSFGYSADSGPGWSLEALGPGLHLALCEATFLRDREGSSPHMSARQAGRTAGAAGVDQLLLTHLWPTVHRGAARAEAAAELGRPAHVATQHQSYPV